MKQIILTVGIAILALGGALVAVFYQQNAYSGTIVALQNKTQEATDRAAAAESRSSYLEKSLAASQTAISQASQAAQSEYELYTNNDLGIKFEYPKGYKVETTLPPAGQTLPGAVIHLTKEGVSLPSIEIRLNPEGAGLISSLQYQLTKIGNQLRINQVIPATVNQDGGEGQDVISASYTENEKSGILMILYYQKSTSRSEFDLLHIIETFTFTK